MFVVITIIKMLTTMNINNIREVTTFTKKLEITTYVAQITQILTQML